MVRLLEIVTSVGEVNDYAVLLCCSICSPSRTDSCCWLCVGLLNHQSRMGGVLFVIVIVVHPRAIVKLLMLHLTPSLSLARSRFISPTLVLVIPENFSRSVGLNLVLMLISTVQLRNTVPRFRRRLLRCMLTTAKPSNLPPSSPAARYPPCNGLFFVTAVVPTSGVSVRILCTAKTMPPPLSMHAHAGRR